MSFGAVAVAAAMARPVAASERKFTYVYEATTEPAGSIEYEQWVTWSTRKASDTEFNRIDFRHELEIGLTDRLQLGVYVADWRWEDSSTVNNRVEYRATAFELIYNLSDPTVDLVGAALYGEVKVGPELLELEGKGILQKNVGKWTFGYNATIEAEWEGDRYTEDKGAFEQTAGVSYQVSPNLTFGAEMLHEVEFDDWTDVGDHAVYLGPNASLRTGDWWATVTPLVQVTNVDAEPDFQVRLIFGFNF